MKIPTTPLYDLQACAKKIIVSFFGSTSHETIAECRHRLAAVVDFGFWKYHPGQSFIISPISWAENSLRDKFEYSSETQSCKVDFPGCNVTDILVVTDSTVHILKSDTLQIFNGD